MYKFPTVPEVPSVDGLLSAGAAEEERLARLKAKSATVPPPSMPAAKPDPAPPRGTTTR
jgi:hypothetical protein